MKLTEFDYIFPEELIAKYPLNNRSASKMMVVNRNDGTIGHHQFAKLSDFITPNDIIVYNKTKVIPARLFGKKETGGACEVLLLHAKKETDRAVWNCITNSSKKIRVGIRILFANNLIGTITHVNETEIREITFNVTGHELDAYLTEHGEMPIPPYLDRPFDRSIDTTRYQTIFANKTGAIASPTAGLHFDELTISKLTKKGIQMLPITLHVGLGTFLPVKTENIEDHNMHTETYDITPETAMAINTAKHNGKRIIAIGTTTVRALESSAKNDGMIHAGKQTTNLFIYGSYSFKIVDVIFTNFHQPKSTLIMMVSSFAGKELLFRAYQEAIHNTYRLFSYGDSMLII